MSKESIENLPEPQHAQGSRYIDRLQIVSHPAYWGPVLQAGDSEGNIMVPHWSELSEGDPIPKEASTPVPRDTVQSLFDSLWRQGYRPTGTRVTLEELPEVSDERMAELAAMKDEDIDTSDIPELTEDLDMEEHNKAKKDLLDLINEGLSQETNND